MSRKIKRKKHIKYKMTKKRIQRGGTTKGEFMAQIMKYITDIRANLNIETTANELISYLDRIAKSSDSNLLSTDITGPDGKGGLMVSYIFDILYLYPSIIERIIKVYKDNGISIPFDVEIIALLSNILAIKNTNNERMREDLEHSFNEILASLQHYVDTTNPPILNIYINDGQFYKRTGSVTSGNNIPLLNWFITLITNENIVLEIIGIFKRHKANMNIEDSLFNTPLMISIHQPNPKYVRELIKIEDGCTFADPESLTQGIQSMDSLGNLNHLYYNMLTYAIFCKTKSRAAPDKIALMAEVVSVILEKVDPNMECFYETSTVGKCPEYALSYALKNNQLDISRMLLGYPEIEPNIIIYQVLAINDGTHILKYKAYKVTLLYYLCYNSWIDRVQLLLSNAKTDPNLLSERKNADNDTVKVTPLLQVVIIAGIQYNAISSLPTDTQDEKINESNKQHIATSMQDYNTGVETIKILLHDQRTDVNIGQQNNGTTPLMLSVPDIDLLSYLLTVSKIDVNVADTNGETALFQACIVDNPQRQISLLLAHRADINIRNKAGLTPLMYACVHDKLESVQTLITNNANVTLEADNGLTPLMISTKNIPILIAILQSPNNDVNKVNKMNGQSALYMACDISSLEAVILLLKYDAAILPILIDILKDEKYKSVMGMVQTTSIEVTSKPGYTQETLQRALNIINQRLSTKKGVKSVNNDVDIKMIIGIVIQKAFVDKALEELLTGAPTPAPLSSSKKGQLTKEEAQERSRLANAARKQKEIDDAMRLLEEKARLKQESSNKKKELAAATLATAVAATATPETPANTLKKQSEEKIYDDTSTILRELNFMPFQGDGLEIPESMNYWTELLKRIGYKFSISVLKAKINTLPMPIINNYITEHIRYFSTPVSDNKDIMYKLMFLTGIITDILYKSTQCLLYIKGGKARQFYINYPSADIDLLIMPLVSSVPSPSDEEIAGHISNLVTWIMGREIRGQNIPMRSALEGAHYQITYNRTPCMDIGYGFNFMTEYIKSLYESNPRPILRRPEDKRYIIIPLFCPISKNMVILEFLYNYIKYKLAPSEEAGRVGNDIYVNKYSKILLLLLGVTTPNPTREEISDRIRPFKEQIVTAFDEEPIEEINILFEQLTDKLLQNSAPQLRSNKRVVIIKDSDGNVINPKVGIIMIRKNLIDKFDNTQINSILEQMGQEDIQPDDSPRIQALIQRMEIKPVAVAAAGNNEQPLILATEIPEKGGKNSRKNRKGKKSRKGKKTNNGKSKKRA